MDTGFMVLYPKFVCLRHGEAEEHQNLGSSEWKKVYCRAMQGERVSYAPFKTLNSETFQQSIFKGKVKKGRGWLLQTSWWWNPLFLQLSM